MKKGRIWLPLHSPWLSGQLAIWGSLMIGSFILALFIRFSSFDANYIPASTYIIHAFSLLIGGFISGKLIGKRGWYYGGCQGIIYTLLLMMIGFLAFDETIRIHPILMAICSFGLSGIGGVMGEHFKHNGMEQKT